MARENDYSEFEVPYDNALIRETSPLNDGSSGIPNEVIEPAGEEPVTPSGLENLDGTIQSDGYRPLESGFSLNGAEGTVKVARLEVGTDGIVSEATSVSAVDGNFWVIWQVTVPSSNVQRMWASDGTDPDGALTGYVNDMCWVKGGYLWRNTDGATAWEKVLTGGALATTRYVQYTVVNYATACSVANGKLYFHVPPAMDGFVLSYCHAYTVTAGTTGTMSVQVHNLTDSQDMLSTQLTIDSGETGSDTAATPYVIDAGHDDVATNDVIRVDVTGIHTTPAKGLVITLGFSPA